VKPKRSSRIRVGVVEAGECVADVLSFERLCRLCERVGCVVVGEEIAKLAAVLAEGAVEP
jgi:hypothetical protein